MSEIDPLTRALVSLRNHLNLAAEEIDAIIKERTPPAVKEPTRGVEEARSLFPKDLEEMLSFGETPEWTLIRPKQYLGSEKFNKVLDIVKDHKGEYVSQRKESHFRIPRGK